MTGFQNVISGVEHYFSAEFQTISAILSPVITQVYAAFKASATADVAAFIAAISADISAGKTGAQLLADALAMLEKDGVQLATLALQAFLNALEAQVAPAAPKS